MPKPEVARWCQAVVEAGRERDWEALSALDLRLRRMLSERLAELDAADRAALSAAYRQAMAASQAELDALQHRLAGMGGQREGQLAYAQFSEWEQQ
ncbi:ABC transporter substrate-binding protein [Chromobacterium sp. IIBBL 290-4]|uniref:ABC transporter substrate-binding protein n=1 Tax=Chromobacterium sp. IIBBL 290-4 TaxID=2953890 RepID=UPI0020B63D85|nr:ABC transporter substrate-binding protein [Chromobacterium sp. IIBBL 290-4]UTH73152.1 ABC transporter substrate-binding protein [Chromobacterium sp. IIBBL 290-4]